MESTGLERVYSTVFKLPLKFSSCTKTFKPAFEDLLSHPFFSVREFTSIKTSAIIRV